VTTVVNETHSVSLTLRSVLSEVGCFDDDTVPNGYTPQLLLGPSGEVLKAPAVKAR